MVVKWERNIDVEHTGRSRCEASHGPAEKPRNVLGDDLLRAFAESVETLQRLADDHARDACASAAFEAEVLSALDALQATTPDCEQLAASVEDFDRAVDQARALIARAPFLQHLQQWPRGYPGDFEAIEHICCGTPSQASGPFAEICERWALTTAVAQQHRNKVAIQSSLIERQAREAHCRMLSIACGGCVDVRRALPVLRGRSFELMLNDADADALAFAVERLMPIADRIVLRHADVLRLLRRPNELGRFDLILAGGLFDYLDDRQIRFVLSRAWALLRPGGTLFFTNIATGNPYRAWMTRLLNWQLKERSRADIADIVVAAQLPPEQLAVERDATGLTLLVRLTKPAP